MNLKAAYEEDFYGWIHRHIELLQQGRVTEIDTAHLIEELKDMGSEKKSELVSRFIVLLAHLLKWQFQFKQLSGQWGEFEGKSWRKTIIEQRIQVANKVEDNPSLTPYLEHALSKAYPKAVAFAVKETGLPKSTFPATCPYSVKQVLDEDYYPFSD